MPKQIDKKAARNQSYKGDEVYAIDLLVSTWRHLSKLCELGLADDDGQQYLTKARELFEKQVRRDERLSSGVRQRLADAVYS
ncbi:MAG: hypothetical protein J6T92_04910 [Ottowia sp.]|nr:hypothetical protein [Ottowia sp.]